jgi:hypothetical protein
MVNPISSSSVTPFETNQVRNAPNAQPTATNSPSDSVHLSPQALAAGDVDHDGDSH